MYRFPRGLVAQGLKLVLSDPSMILFADMLIHRSPTLPLSPDLLMARRAEIEVGRIGAWRSKAGHFGGDLVDGRLSEHI